MSFTTSRLRSQFEQVQQLRQSGQAAVADMLARQIVAAVPSSVEDLYCQASLLLDWNRPADALKRFDEARARGPVPPELLVDRAVALNALDRPEEAIESCRAALDVQRRFAPAHLIWGKSLATLERYDEALEQYGAALKADASFRHARDQRAALLMVLSRAEEALADLQRLLREFANDPSLHNRHGLALAELERFDEALAAFDKGLALAPRDAGLWHNRGVTLWSLECYEAAVESYDRALAVNPGLFVTMSNRANTLQELLRLDEAMAAHDRVVKTWPDYVSGHWNRSQGLLLRGNWAEGFRELQWRQKRPEAVADFAMDGRAEWLGAEDLNGKTLLIRAEQGLGDTLHFVRYAALAQQRGARVILRVQKPLVPLLLEALIPPPEAVIGDDVSLPDFDFHVFFMSLPHAFGTDLGNVPAPMPYMQADPVRVAKWRERLGGHGFKIGISWRGGGRDATDTGRSFSPNRLAPLAGLPGVRLISLQKGDAALAQLQDLPPQMIVETLADFDEGDGAFLDTAAVMANCDLVISSDTAVAHLAGALGRPTWLALKYVPEWRWMLHRSDSVWYPSARLFRQQAVGDWSAAFAAMETELKKLLAAQDPP
jgi:tetratricopeptide (TPR) repeat protein